MLLSFSSEGGLHLEVVGRIPLRTRSYANGRRPGGLAEVVASPLAWRGGLVVADVDGSVAHVVLAGRAGLQERKRASAGPMGGALLAMAVSDKFLATLSRHGEVALFDEDLRLLWRARAAESEQLREGALSFWADGVRRGDKGTVLVLVRDAMPSPSSSSVSGRTLDVRVLALDESTGETRWDSDVARDLTAAELAARSGMDGATFRRHLLAAAEGGDGPGEADWTAFGPDFERALPFVWRGPADSAVAARAWRNASLPNVVLARHGRGLTAFHAFSGRVLARLPLDPGALHLDADGDGLVESLGVALPLTLGADGLPLPSSDTTSPRCEGWVRGGLPATRAAAAVPLCHGLSDAQRVGLSGSGPLFVAPDLHHRQQQQQNQQGGLLAYLLSSGELVVADARFGRRALPPAVRVASPAAWTPDSEQLRFVGITAYGPRLALLTGDRFLAVASTHGRVLATLPLNETAIREPLVAHLNRDKHWDVVVTSASAVTVIRSRPERASRLTGFLVLALLGLMGAAAFVLTREKKA